jgi:hypothetical protein
MTRLTLSFIYRKEFKWDDPFLGGVARPGLDLEKLNL